MPGVNAKGRARGLHAAKCLFLVKFSKLVTYYGLMEVIFISTIKLLFTVKENFT